MVSFPLEFEIEVTAEPGISAPWRGKAADLDEIECSIPTEFGGPGKTYSPEDLFALSIVNCIVATFKVYAEKAGLTFKSLSAKAKLKMDRDASTGTLSLPDIHIAINISGASDVDRVRKTLDTAISHCAVSNSAKSGKNFTIEVK